MQDSTIKIIVAHCNVCLRVQVEDEIQTLSQVLAAKEKRLAEIKRKLGITPLNELKHNITKTWQEVTTSNAYVPSDSTCLSTFYFFFWSLFNQPHITGCQSHSDASDVHPFIHPLLLHISPTATDEPPRH